MDARRLEGQIERGTAKQKEALDAALGAQPLGPAGRKRGGVAQESQSSYMLE